MNKKFLIFSLLLVFTLVSALSGITFATTHTLEELLDKFNNCDRVQQYKEYGYLLSAKAENNTLIIETDNNETKNSYEYTLNGSILSATVDEFGLLIHYIVTDCVGQLNGYEANAVFDTLNSEEIMSYTIENEGFEVKIISDGQYEVKLDLDKKIPLVDISKMYLKPDDFKGIRELVEHGIGGGQSGYRMKMVYRVSVYSNGDTEIIIGEKDEITESTYKSVLSAIEVLFDDVNAAEYFKANYKSIEDGNKEFAGFNVEVNIDSEAFSDFEGAKKTMITVDMEAALKAMENMWNTELSNAVAKAEDIMNNRTVNYTEESIARLRDVMIDGEKFLNEKTNDEEKAKELVTSINEAIESLEKEYTLEGANQNFKLEEGKHLTFKFDIPYDDFKTYGDIWIDEHRIEEDNYTAESGSTVITFKDEFTNTLSEGSHHIEVPLAQGRLGIAKTDFTIEKVAAVSDDKATNTPQKSSSSNPRTGDNVFIFTGIVIFALTGLSVTYYGIKKK